MDHNIINYGHERCKRIYHQVHVPMYPTLMLSTLFSTGNAGIEKKKLRTECHNKQRFKKS